jgi:Protein of unknown function (DUF2589)
MAVSIGAEVQQLPLGFVLSAPLTAAIEAQALSAQNTIEFVNTLGADEFGDLRVMTFNYETNVTDPVTGDPAVREVVLTVPVLSMVEAPHIAIEDLSVGFEFTIREVLSRENELKLAGSWSSDTAISNTTDVNVSSSTSGLMKFLYGERSTTVNSNTSISIKNSMSVSAAYRTSSKEDVERRATLKLNMTAKQRVPEGFQRVLTIFADAISAQATPKPEEE